MNNIDIALIALPVLELQYPAPAIYSLKGCLNKHNFNSKCLNLYTYSKQHHKEFEEINEYFLYTNDIQDDKLLEKINIYYKRYILEIVKPLNPKWVGLSLFSNNSRKASVILCKFIRKYMPNTKIVIGGFGAKDPFTQDLLSNNLIDYYITGEGEISLIELLKGNKEYPGINNSNYTQISNLDNLSFPDYSDYYKEYKKLKAIALIGSRGCLRNCTFCNINTEWKNYYIRSAENIYKEIIRNKKEYKSSHMFFNDSLVNGNIPEFKKLARLLVDYHKNNKEHKDKIRWGGQFVIHKKTLFIEKDFELLKASGFSWASVGLETISEKVRKHMRKPFSNEDVYFTIDNLLKNNISINLMFLIGYPIETIDMFRENITFLKKYAKHSKNIQMNLGLTCAIEQNSKLIGLSVYKNLKSCKEWESTVVSNLDLKERITRRIEIANIAKDLGYNIRWNEKQLKQLLNMV